MTMKLKIKSNKIKADWRKISIKQAIALVRKYGIDHYVVGKNRVASFRSRGKVSIDNTQYSLDKLVLQNGKNTVEIDDTYFIEAWQGLDSVTYEEINGAYTMISATLKNGVYCNITLDVL